LTVVATPNVYEDARETPGQESSAPRWAWLTVGLVLGAGATVLALGVDTPARESAETAADPAIAPAIGGMTDVVEGFPDGLVAVTRSDGQSLELLIWPLQGEPYERAIPVGVARPPGPVDFDKSGRRIATLLPMPDTELGVLYAGIPENAEIVATGVTGYAWHDSVPYLLAYTTFADDEFFLWVMRPGSREPELAARAVGIDGSVSAWGDWGYGVQDRGKGAILFTPTGEIKDSHPGRILTSYRTGWLAVDNEGVELLSSGGGVRGLGGAGLADEVLTGRFSDDGEKLALLTSDGVLQFSLTDDSVLLESGGTPGLSRLVWSSDGRFVLYPGERGVWAIDTVDGDSKALLTDRVFTGLAVTPIGGP